MFVVVARKGKVIRVSGLTVNAACWLGFKFARDNPDLIGKKGPWIIVAFEAVPEQYSRDETYRISSNWFRGAREVAKIIENPPSPVPVHTCSDCNCKPERCKGE